MNHLDNPLWKSWPWRTWKSPAEQFKVLPTFAVTEWTYRALTITCAIHAHRTGNWPLWFSSWICGTFNDAFFMAMPFCDNFWQAQASIMLTPRMPLYIVEMYAAILYSSTTAARRFKLPYLSESALCGLLAHALYHTYDINGPRYLWWTWHDSDPSIGKRQLNAPIGSSLWILTYCALHNALNRWTNDAAFPGFFSLAKLVSQKLELGFHQFFGKHTHTLFRLLETCAERVDQVHKVLLPLPSIVKIVFCGSLCTPLFMMSMGPFQILGMDTLGIPGTRTYRMALFIYTAILARAFHLKETDGKPSLVTSLPVQKANLLLLRAVVCFYSVQCAISLFGKPECHVSTGCHQKVGESKLVKDIMGYKREEYLKPSGPELYSPTDYSFPSKDMSNRFDDAGRQILVPDLETNSTWYTVLGKKHESGRRMAEFLGVLSFSCIGTALYGLALAGPM